ncbi:DNA-directed RNA polymerase III complex subunit Rpc25 [Tilletia horrida]|uniref:DNA-directed RNA polymerase III complex subunit Rpc25 n=1 Tax=Tilletia horrida TaxID=155126 RepID=A0AAN6H094_9BASI|nr:DNA-directed RNA polymerase III complex subunit Rpc25 [Tilletia horrida]KAK0557064.1 DNA-directed RNA polymerase III complex subunit Rpc25 [Tilletia horrida]
MKKAFGTSVLPPVSLDFFDDIYVLPQLMPDICAFDHHERAWFWIYQPPPDESDPVATQQSRITDPYTTNRDDRLYMYVGDQIRFSVEEDEFNDPEPGPSAATSTLPGGVMEGAKIGGGAFAPAPAPGVGPAGAQGGNVASAAGAAPGEAGTGPTIQASADGTTAPAGAAFMERLAPYILVGSIAAQGLGIVGWWGDDQGTQEEAAMEDVNGYQEGAEA